MSVRTVWLWLIAFCLACWLGLILAVSAVAATVEGTPGMDYLEGTAHADTIYGKGGADQIYGRRGADEIHCGSGQDICQGNRGNDSIYAHDGTYDEINCGKGKDDFAYVDFGLDSVVNCERGIG